MTHYYATLVSHTHWDRAWYVTFQEYRIRLVRLVDRLLDLLNDQPDFRVFMLDGQMSVIEDYLEARPEKAPELQAFCRSGRIQVGPWFVLADEFLVSPEALIRNLKLGFKMGEAYGGVMPIGYVPDGFGHIAQLPQIFRGFGLDNAFFWRGMGGDGDRLGTEFTWCAADGSDVTAILMPWGYHNVNNLGYGIHWGDISEMVFNNELAQEKIRRAIDKLTPMANTNAILLMNGIDHAEAEPRIPQIIADANTRLGDSTVQQGTLAEHLERVRASGAQLREFEGEFRWGRYSEILQGVYSTRMHLKQENHRSETLLERYVEPLTALAWLSGADIPEGTPDMVALAWHWLLLNHPHDDIYGSGIDEVHHEMAYRFSQSKQIGDYLVRDSLRQIAQQVDYTGQTGTPIIVYNPLGWSRREIVEAQIDFDFDDPKADAFQLINASREIIPHQVIRDQQLFWMEVLKPNRKRRVTVLFPTQIPACGYTTVYAQPSEEAEQLANQSDLLMRPDGAENAFLTFTVASDGGLSVTDKATGATYSDLGHLSHVTDAGDEYTFCPLQGETPLTTKGSTAQIGIERQSPLSVAFRVERVLNVPASLTPDRQRRSHNTVALHFTTQVVLYAHQPGLYLTTCFENRADDYKLTVDFPTGLNVAQAHLDESFLIAERDLRLPDSTGWVEDPTALMHQRAFTDLSDGTRGLAILNRGLPSVEVSADGIIALTLLRAVGWLSRDDLWVRRIAAGPLVPTPGAQCHQTYSYEYAILPHIGDWRNVYTTAYNYNVPLLARRADTHAGLELREMNITRDDPSRVTQREWPRGGAREDTLSFVAVEPRELILSAVYRSGASLIVRVYNVTREAISGAIRFGFPVIHANRVNMLEQEQALLTVKDDAVNIDVRGGEVYTLKVTPS